MDSLLRWYGQYLDPKELAVFLSRSRDEYGKSTKFFELETALIFVRIWETKNLRGVWISIPTLDKSEQNPGFALSEIFDKKMAFDEDFDINLGLKDKLTEVTTLFQIVRVPNQIEMNATSLVDFLAKKKFRIPKDENLSLLVRSDKSVSIDYLNLHQQLKRIRVPYGEVFIVSLEPANLYRSIVFVGYQVFPEAKLFGVIDFKSLPFLFGAL